MPGKTIGYENRTKSAQSGGLERNGPNGENFWPEVWSRRAEVCLGKSANIGVLRNIKSGERKFGIARLAEGEELETNILLRNFERIHSIFLRGTIS
jgi:hypothetical protein